MDVNEALTSNWRMFSIDKYGQVYRPADKNHAAHYSPHIGLKMVTYIIYILNDKLSCSLSVTRGRGRDAFMGMRRSELSIARL